MNILTAVPATAPVAVIFIVTGFFPGHDTQLGASVSLGEAINLVAFCAMLTELIRSVRSADAAGALNHFLSFALFVLAAAVIAMSAPLWSFNSIVIMSYLATDCVLSNLLAQWHARRDLSVFNS